MINQKRRTKWSLMALFFIFVFPAVAAWYMFYHFDNRVFGTTNKGQLLTPTVAASSFALSDYRGKSISPNEKKWVLIYNTKTCAKDCKKTLDKILRVRLSLGKELNRTDAWLISQSKMSPRDYKILVHPRGLNMKAYLLKGDKSKTLSLTGNDIFLMDPNGNVMMRYQKDANPRDIYKDLKHLLKISNIG